MLVKAAAPSGFLRCPSAGLLGVTHKIPVLKDLAASKRLRCGAELLVPAGSAGAEPWVAAWSGAPRPPPDSRRRLNSGPGWGCAPAGSLQSLCSGCISDPQLQPAIVDSSKGTAPGGRVPVADPVPTSSPLPSQAAQRSPRLSAGALVGRAGPRQLEKHPSPRGPFVHRTEPRAGLSWGRMDAGDLSQGKGESTGFRGSCP